MAASNRQRPPLAYQPVCRQAIRIAHMAAQRTRPMRQRLLEAGHEEVYLHGFQGTSLGAILQRAEATKGAFFHYFATKKAFGYAIVDEVLAQMIAAQWVSPLEASHDPLETIGTEFERGIDLLKIQRPILGCP